MFTLLMLISHTISDFILQSKDVVELKSKMKLKGFLKHGLYTLGTALLAIIGSTFTVLQYVLFITVIHMLIDFFKESTQNFLKRKYNNDQFGVSKFNRGKLLLFILDQVLHIGMIIALTKHVTVEFGLINEWMSTLVFSKNMIHIEDLKVVFIILYVTFTGVYLVPLVLNVIYSNIPGYNDKLSETIKLELKEQDNNDFIDEVKTGKWIGILERALMLIFIFSNQFAAIGVIVTVKSLARFKMMDNKIFSEYYLLGTLLSVVHTIGGYFVLTRLI
jgi:hypothetical protein